MQDTKFKVIGISLTPVEMMGATAVTMQISFARFAEQADSARCAAMTDWIQ